MSLTSILSAEAIENAVKDCQGITVFLLDWTRKTSKMQESFIEHMTHFADPALIFKSLFSSVCH